MHCPLCIDTVLDPTFRSGIEIDRCPRCKGIWLDRGELDKIVGDTPARGIADRHERPDQRRYDDSRGIARHSYDHEHSYEYKKSKKGKKLADLLDDVLDF